VRLTRSGQLEETVGAHVGVRLMGEPLGKQTLARSVPRDLSEDRTWPAGSCFFLSRAFGVCLFVSPPPGPRARTVLLCGSEGRAYASICSHRDRIYLGCTGGY
jgi:hypothetical protein